jgi:hypothetical protein
MSTDRPTVEEVARSAWAAVNAEANILLGAQWTGERYAQLASRTALRALRRQGELVVPAVVLAGTVTVSRGTNVVSGDATAQAAWSPALIGRFFQGRTAWYEITGIQSGVGVLNGQPLLQLAVPFAEADVAGGSYHVVARYLTLADDARRLGCFTFERWRRQVLPSSTYQLDYENPERQYFTTGPNIVAEHNSDAEGRKVIEVYPYSLTTEHVTYRYVARPPKLELHDLVPGEIDVWVLKAGVLIDVYRYMASKAAQAADIQGAGYWRNESRAQESTFEQAILRAVQADRGVDDTSAWLRSSIPYNRGHRYITDAHSEVWSRGV